MSFPYKALGLEDFRHFFRRSICLSRSASLHFIRDIRGQQSEMNKSSLTPLSFLTGHIGHSGFHRGVVGSCRDM